MGLGPFPSSPLDHAADLDSRDLDLTCNRVVGEGRRDDLWEPYRLPDIEHTYTQKGYRMTGLKLNFDV